MAKIVLPDPEENQLNCNGRIHSVGEIGRNQRTIGILFAFGVSAILTAGIIMALIGTVNIFSAVDESDEMYY